MDIRISWADVQRGDQLVDSLGRVYFVVEDNHRAVARGYYVVTGRRLLGDGVTAGGHKLSKVTVRREA